MKFVFLLIMVLFSYSANAAVLIQTNNAWGATQMVGISSLCNSVNCGFGQYDPSLAFRDWDDGSPNWDSYFNVTSDIATDVKVTWSFFNNQGELLDETDFLSVEFTTAYREGLDYFDINGSYSAIYNMQAGVSYALNIYDASTNISEYSVSVSPVSEPAMFALFLPAFVLAAFVRPKKQR